MKLSVSDAETAIRYHNSPNLKKVVRILVQLNAAAWRT